MVNGLDEDIKKAFLKDLQWPKVNPVGGLPSK
jgi:hypothetical protein